MHFAAARRDDAVLAARARHHSASTSLRRRRKSRPLACLPGLTQRTAANRLRANGAPVFRARGGAQRERCSYRVVLSRTLLRGGSSCARPNRGCTMRPFRRQQRANAPRCAVALSGIAQVLALFLSRKDSCPVGCPPFSATSGVARAPRPNAAVGALVTKFAPAAHFAHSRFPRARHLPLVTASARVLRKIGAARAVRS